MYQEHNNLLTKVIYSAKGSNLTHEVLENKISTNIRTFGEVMSTMMTEFGVPKRSTKHSTVRADEEIEKLVRALRDNGNLDHVPAAEERTKPMVDLFGLGMVKLAHIKRLDDFRRQNQDVGLESYGGPPDSEDFVH
ncbi:hypothetical protein BGX20_007771, partial [Mortierella sp. AD010]